MNKTITAQQLRDRVGEYLDRADYGGDTIVVTRFGREKAVLLSFTRYLELTGKTPISDEDGSDASAAKRKVRSR